MAMGKKRYITEVIAEEVEFADTLKELITVFYMLITLAIFKKMKIQIMILLLMMKTIYLFN